ncbi:hypothetical protein P1J78_24740, partial [Psychromarinibacter sp. C21-152]
SASRSPGRGDGPRLQMRGTSVRPILILFADGAAHVVEVGAVHEPQPAVQKDKPKDLDATCVGPSLPSARLIWPV